MEIFRGRPVVTHFSGKRGQNIFDVAFESAKGFCGLRVLTFADIERWPSRKALRTAAAVAPRQARRGSTLRSPPESHRRRPFRTAAPPPRRDSNSTPACRACPVPAMSASPTPLRSEDSPARALSRPARKFFRVGMGNKSQRQCLVVSQREGALAQSRIHCGVRKFGYRAAIRRQRIFETCRSHAAAQFLR